jgi:hypothetical protein
MSRFFTKGFYLTVFLFSLFFLVFFRSGIGLRLSGDFDEQCYLAMAEKLVGANSSGCMEKSHFPGIAFLWFPAAALGRLVAWLLNETPHDWIAAFCGFCSFLFWCLTVLLFQKIIIHYDRPDKKRGDNPFNFGFLSLSFILILNVPSFYYSYARTLMAHSGEVFLSFLFLYLTIRKKALYSGLALVFLILTRPNNLGAVFVYFSAFGTQREFLFKYLRWLSLMSVLILVAYFGFYKGYHGTYLIPSLIKWDLNRLVLFFFRTDLGIVWNQSLWTLVLLGAFFKLAKLNSFQESLLSWMTTSILFTLFWPTAGSSFGYRYLLGSHAAALLLFLELSVVYQSFFLKFKKAIGAFLALGALWAINQYWSSTAPPPFWPWQDPFLKTLTPPFWIVENWWLRFPDMLRLFQFSSVWQILCLFGAPEPYLTFKGEHVPYFFEGSHKIFSLGLSLLALSCLFLSLFKMIRYRTR